MEIASNIQHRVLGTQKIRPPCYLPLNQAHREPSTPLSPPLPRSLPLRSSYSLSDAAWPLLSSDASPMPDESPACDRSVEDFSSGFSAGEDGGGGDDGGGGGGGGGGDGGVGGVAGRLPSTSSTYCCRISFWRFVSDRGMVTSNWTSKSPLSPLLIKSGTPLPRSSISSPTCVPDGTRTSTLPSSVGTRTLPPRIAVWKGTVAGK